MTKNKVTPSKRASKGIQSPKVVVKNAPKGKEKLAKVLKYSQLLRQSPQQLEEREFKYRNEDALAQIIADISLNSRELDKMERELEELWLTSSLNFQNIIALETKIENKKLGLARLIQIKSERF